MLLALPAAAQPPHTLPVTSPVVVVNPQPLPVTVTNQGQPVNINGTVPVENVDEPGRQPYEAYIEFTRFSCSGFNCSNFASLGDVVLFDGPVVPSGKRLVLQHVSGRVPNAGTDNVSVLLQQSQVLSQQLVKWGFYGPFFPQFSLTAFSAPAYTTYGPGERPHLNLILPAGNNFVGYIALSGYLIDN